MASPSSNSLAERPERLGESRREASGPGRGVVFVVGFGGSLAADYAGRLRREGDAEVVLLDEPTAVPPRVECGPASLAVFLPSPLDERARRRLGDLLEAVRGGPIAFVGVVGSFRVHLDDERASETERTALAMIESTLAEARVAVFRPGLVIGTNSGLGRRIERLGSLFPLAPRGLRTCFLEADRLFEAIDAEAAAVDEPVEGGRHAAGRPLGRRRRAYTLLGENTAWRDVLERRRCGTLAGRATTAAAHVLSWLLLGRLLAAVVGTASRWSPAARSWSVATLKPRSMRELISLCHRGNIGSVRVVGYNNGVNHFGHRHPGKTIVSTVRLRRTVHAGPGVLKTDGGATIRAVKDYLGGRGEELYVMPNYSYVAVGTSFFVPIHGSAVDYATVADTACRVVLYDPDRDCIVSADRDDEAFRENVYNHRSRAVLLRLYLRTRPRSSYYVRRETWQGPNSSDLLAALRDRDAANVEVRQSHAASGKATIARYYTEASGPSGPALESPRDALGRLWDRLEENPVTSFLMHALSRHVAWHTELFLTPDEFERFWDTHHTVPLRKIQLRYIRRDGMPHSPFRDEDCVSADLFLFRSDKPAFDAYVAEQLPNVRCNPGKHSH